MAMVWAVPPGLMIIWLMKPEFWLNCIMWIFYSPLVRWQVLVLAGSFNVYGIFKKIFIVPKQLGSYEQFRKEMIETMGVEGEEMAQKMDKLARHKPDVANARESLSQPIL